jgi:hypothetical protein
MCVCVCVCVLCEFLSPPDRGVNIYIFLLGGGGDDVRVYGGVCVCRCVCIVWTIERRDTLGFTPQFSLS